MCQWAESTVPLYGVYYICYVIFCRLQEDNQLSFMHLSLYMCMRCMYVPAYIYCVYQVSHVHLHLSICVHTLTSVMAEERLLCANYNTYMRSIHTRIHAWQHRQWARSAARANSSAYIYTRTHKHRHGSSGNLKGGTQCAQAIYSTSK